MKIESFVLKFYQQECEPKKMHMPVMPEHHQRALESVRDNAVAIGVKACSDGAKALAKALSAIPTEWPEVTKAVEELDAKIAQVKADKQKRPDCMPDMKKAVSFVKRMSNTHITDLISECDKDAAALLALLEVSREVDDGRYAEQIEGILSDMVVGYNTSERLQLLEQERREVISYSEQVQESLVQSIGKQFAPHLVQASATAKLDAIR